ncbi:MAG: hypothetical protein IGS48_12250 [Oscillatoriales cyanobacterium C42_A2020_001]|nr:hypothetical protein [Leptolyngbyaceae cyanobacterium C42_A2020_001]
MWAGNSSRVIALERIRYDVRSLGCGISISQCLIPFDYWADQADRMTPVWDEVLRTLTLGLYIRDPTTGAAFPD